MPLHPVSVKTRVQLLLRLAAAIPHLPPRVTWFQLRALAIALAQGDTFSLASASSPERVVELLRLAHGRRRVVELGTATAWTAGALALADPARRVVTYDPVVQPWRERYLRLLGARALARVMLVAATGADAAADLAAEAPDLLFIDASHERAATLDEWHAWRPRLTPGALVVFDDYGHPDFPGVAEAIRALGLQGRARAGMFVWEAPGAAA